MRVTDRWAMATICGWSEDNAAASGRAGPVLDDSSDPVAPALETLDLLVAPALDSSDRLES